MQGPKQILVAIGDDSDALALRHAFERDVSAYIAQTAPTLAAARALMQAWLPDLIIAAHELPDGPGVALVGDQCPVIVVTHHEPAIPDLIDAGAIDALKGSNASFAAMPAIAARSLRAWAHLAAARRTEDALDRERDFARKVLDAAPVIVLALDLEARILSVNKYFEAITGYTAAEVEGLDWLETFLHPSDRARVAEIFELALGGGRTRGNVNPIVTKDGSQRLIEWYDTPLTDDSSRRTGLIAIGLDITDKRELTRRLDRARKLEALGRLAGGVAHDVNNVLMGISGCVNLALDRLAPSHPARPFVEEARRAAISGAAVPRRLLEFSRERESAPQLHDLDGVVGSVASLLRRVLGDDIELSRVSDAQGALVRCDAVVIEQVLLNLAVNARDAMPDGGRLQISTGTATVDAASHLQLDPGRYVTLSVADSGCGMSEETSAHAFEPFFTTKAPGQGTGLGLSSVYGLVRQSGGDIIVDSALDSGTTFTIYLPRAADTDPLPAPPPPQEARRSAAKTVLLVEDEPLVRLTVRSYLEGQGHHILEADSGDEALKLSDGYPKAIDLLLTDVALPGMAGPDVAKAINARRPSLRVLYMSAHPTELLVDEGQLPPDATALAKPFDAADLAEAISSVLEAAR